MMEDQPPLTSLDGSRERNPPERSPCPIYSVQEDSSSDSVGENLNIIIVEVTGSEEPFRKEEEIPTGTIPDESGNQSGMQTLMARRYGLKEKEGDEEEEEETEDDEDYNQESLNVAKSKMDKDKTSSKAIEEEEEEVIEVIDLTAAEFQTNPLQGYRTIASDRPFSCKDCGGLFKHKSSLVLHRRIHSGEKPFSCSQCGRRFTQKANVIRHQRLHTGEKPYTCPQCGKQYAHKHSLMMHQKFHAEPYPCPDCDASFLRQSHLVTHRKIHKGLQRYICPDCGDVFMLRSSLTMHEKVHSAERPISSGVGWQ